jgi:hypothetical protein
VEQRNSDQELLVKVADLAFSKLVKLLAVLSLFMMSPAFAQTSSVLGSSSITSKAEATSSIFDSSGISFFYLTSRTSQSTSYQTMKSMSGGDGGSSDGATLPNLNYISAAGFLHFRERHTFMLTGLQSLDSEEQLKIATPFGVDFRLPSQVAFVRYRYQLDPTWNAELKAAYIDTVGARDPSAGVVYFNPNPLGWSQSYSLYAAAPVTSASQRQERWTFAGSASHFHSFFENGKPPPRSIDKSVTKASIPIFPSEVDLILLQKETERTRGDLSFSYSVNDELSLGAGAGLSFSKTEKDHTLWMTSCKPLIAKYHWGQAEVSSDVSLNSDIKDYNSPRTPTYLSVGLRAGYTLGSKPQQM